MASLNELAAAINSVGVAGADARNHLGTAIESIQTALNSMGALGDGESANMMKAMLVRCLADMQSAQGHIDMAHDVGQAWVQRLYM
jgi:hypothetical protein